jgi:hypothetical protein
MKIRVYVVEFKAPRWARQALVIGGSALVVLGLSALVYAAAVNGQPDYTDGEVLTAASLNAHLGALQSQIDTANTNATDLAARVTALEGLRKLTMQATGGFSGFGTPPANAQFIVSAGDRIAQIDASGNTTITFDQPFPNGVIAVVPAWTDSPCGSVLITNGPAGWVTKTGFPIHTSCSSVQVRINYIAIGW